MFKLRKYITKFLIYLARKIDPQSEYVNIYLKEQLIKAYFDSITYGTGCVKVEYIPYNEIPDEVLINKE